MIKIEKAVIPSDEQWEVIIQGMRNAMNSWDKSDSKWVQVCGYEEEYFIGLKDQELMYKLSKAGTDHRKFMRMIVVYLDITAPLYWWKEFDTYKVGTVANSCSTMHKIHEKEFTLEDFSCEHLINYGGWYPHDVITSVQCSHLRLMKLVIESLNGARNRYLDYKSRGKDYEERAKEAWWQMIQLLPSSYNQKRTVMLNYEVLANIYHSRKNHKLDEWRALCEWIESLPYSELITGLPHGVITRQGDGPWEPRKENDNDK